MLHNFQLFRPFPFSVKSGRAAPISIFFHHLLYPMKEKSRGRAGIGASIPYNFFYFSGHNIPIYVCWLGANRAGFSSCARVRLTALPFSPANMCIYIIGSRGANGWDGSGGSSRLELQVGIICLVWYECGSNRHEKAESLAWCDMRRQLVYLISEWQVAGCSACAELRANDNDTLFHYRKMCECTKITRK